MNDEIDGGPAFSDCIERPIERAHVRHVAFDKEFGAALRRQRPHALFQRIPLIGKGGFSAFRGQLPSYSHSQRLVLGPTHDKPALSPPQPHHIYTPPSLLDWYIS